MSSNGVSCVVNEADADNHSHGSIGAHLTTGLVTADVLRGLV